MIILRRFPNVLWKSNDDKRNATSNSLLPSVFFLSFCRARNPDVHSFSFTRSHYFYHLNDFIMHLCTITRAAYTPTSDELENIHQIIRYHRRILQNNCGKRGMMTCCLIWHSFDIYFRRIKRLNDPRSQSVSYPTERLVGHFIACTFWEEKLNASKAWAFEHFRNLNLYINEIK